MVYTRFIMVHNIIYIIILQFIHLYSFENILNFLYEQVSLDVLSYICIDTIDICQLCSMHWYNSLLSLMFTLSFPFPLQVITLHLKLSLSYISFLHLFNMPLDLLVKTQISMAAKIGVCSSLIHTFHISPTSGKVYS